MASRTVSAVFLAALISLSLAGRALAAEVTVSSVTQFNNALDAAMASGTSDTINIAAGTYTITTVLNYYDKDEDGLALVGAGPGATILDGGGVTQILHIDTTGGAGQVSQIVIRDMTLQNGNSPADGGAVYAATNAAGLVVDSVEFFTNTSTDNGGGLYFTTTNGLMTVQSSVFEGNQATGGSGFPAGGGLWGRLNFGSRILVEETGFSSNTAQGGSGGGASLGSQGSGDITVRRSTFLDNSSGGQGGGLSATVLGGSVSVTNALMARNESSSRGAGFFASSSSGVVSAANNTVAANTGSGSFGGGMYVMLSTNGATAEIANNIVVNNRFNSFDDDIYINDLDTPPNTAAVNYNDYLSAAAQNGTNVTYTGNLQVDPQFIDSGSGNYRLSSASPCIDAGQNALGSGTVDLAGNERFVDDPDTADSGDGVAPVVDMGAYEFQLSSSGGGGGGCNTSPASKDPIWAALFLLMLMGGIFVRRVHRAKGAGRKRYWA